MSTKEYTIVTTYIHPAIPHRGHDWCARLKGEEECQNRTGWGRTEKYAITDLFELLELEVHDKE